MNHATALQLSLLVALGIVPIACGGTTSNDPEENGGSGGSGTSGTGTTGGTTAKAGSSNHGGSGGGKNAHACTAPTTDPVTGLVTCAEGYSHRPTSVVCGGTPAGAADAAPGASLPRADGTVACGGDATICSQFLYGYCGSLGGGGPVASPTCLSGCATDFDCGTGYVCNCSSDPNATVPGVCLPAGCTTDQDCDAGFCTPNQQVCGSSGFACQTAADKCQTDADCGGRGQCTWEGNYDVDPPTYHRECTSLVCGRPFLVECEARVAPVVKSAAWSAATALSPRLDHLTTAERAALAEHWTAMGQMEHASIAAFARFSLQLLALGAPPELVDACTQALADETTHTKLCFALASAYAGHAVGPGPLDVGGSLEVTSLAEIVDLVIAEGCFGETNAALEALEAADAASDPVIVAAYSQIARDEQRHAELAFRFVRWALGRDRETVAARIQAALKAPAPGAAHAVALPCLRALLQSGEPTPKYAAA